MFDSNFNATWAQWGFFLACEYKLLNEVVLEHVPVDLDFKLSWAFTSNPDNYYILGNLDNVTFYNNSIMAVSHFIDETVEIYLHIKDLWLDW